MLALLPKRVSNRTRRAATCATAAVSLAALYIGCSSDPGEPVPSTFPADATADDRRLATPSTDASGVAVPEAEAAVDAAFDCTAEGGANEAPHDLRCTGLYADWGSKTVSAAINRPYTPGLTFWSDGASKTRWLYLPPGTKIDTSDMDEWVFPVGTKAWKEFSLGGKPIETRLLWKRGDADWVRTTYRWSDDQSRATRLDDGELAVNGTTYQIPSQGECDQCHQGRKDRLLGIEAIALGVAGGSGITLESLAAEGVLTTKPARTSLTLPDDGSGKAPAALGWLHINCGVTCHNRNPEAVSEHTKLFMRLSATSLLGLDGGSAVAQDTDTWRTAVNVRAETPPYPAMGLYRIRGGDLGKSLIVTLPETRTNPPSNFQMPPIVSHEVDTVGLLNAKTWTLTLPSPADAGDGG